MDASPITDQSYHDHEPSDDVVKRMRATMDEVGIPEEAQDGIIDKAFSGAAEIQARDKSVMGRSTGVLVELFTSLGADHGSAVAAALLLNRSDIDLTKLMATTKMASDGLGINFVALKGHRDKDSFAPWIWHKKDGEYARHMQYGLHHLLTTMAWRDMVEHRGGFGVKHMPPNM